MFRLILGASLLVLTPLAWATAAGAAGIANLHTAGLAADQNVLINESVDYNVIRVFWSQLEPQDDQFDFSYLDSEITLAAALGKKTVLRVIAGRGSPDWILNNPAIAAVTYSRTRQDGLLVTEKVPAPWQLAYKKEFKELLGKLAAAYSNQIAAVSICGMDQACGINLGPDWTYKDWLAVGYSPRVYQKTINWFINLYNQSFPASLLIFHTGKPFGDLSILTRSVSYGRRTVGPNRFGLMAENLKASFESGALPDSKRQVMIDYARRGGWIGYQSIWPVTNDRLNVNDCLTAESDGDCLQRAVAAGVKDGSRYFEFYQEDIAALPENIKSIDLVLDSL